LGIDENNKERMRKRGEGSGKRVEKGRRGWK